jgi:hypothetical protein
MKLRRYAVMTCLRDELMGFASLYPSYTAIPQLAPYFAASANAPRIRAQERMPL